MKNRKMILSVACYVVAAVLLCVYLCVLYISLFKTNTSAEYEMLYIKNEMSSYISTDVIETYRTNIVYDYSPAGNDGARGKGWSMIEDDGTWMVGEESTLLINVDKSQGDRYTLRMNLVSWIELYDTYVYVNDQELGLLEPASNVKLDIPDDMVQDGINTITFKTRNVKQISDISNTTDARRLVLKARTVCLEQGN